MHDVNDWELKFTDYAANFQSSDPSVSGLLNEGLSNGDLQNASVKNIVASQRTQTLGGECELLYVYKHVLMRDEVSTYTRDASSTIPN